MDSDNQWCYAYFIRLEGTARMVASVSGNAKNVQAVRDMSLRNGFVETTYWQWLWFRLFRILPNDLRVYTDTMIVESSPE